MKLSTVPCPQCSSEQDYHSWAQDGNETRTSNFYNDKNPCPKCSNRRKLPVNEALKAVGKPRDAILVERFFATYKKPVVTPSGRYIIPLS